ncbi:LuxR C-terminal-related transcriptional regulator [Ensifer adhaerens]|uniref:transcriptional regulator VisR n=1 Tax=Ensifer adhaerens TaxID=106592 RepID=UPI000DE1E220|nr:LuxR family transcriptional regulator [Ensifer adhaerens]MBZ7920417.1 LuxR C-terminal-related transcriptional regulator [Ensifer adhaerens]UAX92901.1 LuxR C-terminal-related transcriptional regulator [Ensifer adhaerens]UAY00536.1 LuxR C-terminal-related transcriptional regulator [Ensifer adhaerens]UAY07918.1 LuxR C-terminal-related transcriptional regulator [Ensifer adhaerens]
MTHFLGGGRIDDEQKLARQGNRAARAATLVTRLQAMQRQINAKHFAVLRLNGKGTARKLTCVLDNWGLSAEANAHDLVSIYGEELIAHLDQSLLPVLWNGAGEHQAAEVFDLAPFAHRLKARNLSFSGIAFPVRLGAQGNGYVIFAGNYVDASTEQVVDLHGRSCMIMTDLLAADEKRMAPAETLSDREIACLQMAGDGHISEEIAERMGLSVHTVNAYLGAATTKLDSVNRIQAIAKAIRLGYIS